MNTRHISFVALSLLTAILSGCAWGNHYDYQSVRATIPQASKKSAVAVVVVDQRPDVISSSHDNNYIGTTRDGYGIPFKVYTRSGSPLSEDLSKAITSSLIAAGYQATDVSVSPVTDITAAKSKLLSAPADRKVLITLNKWESSTLINTELDARITIEVYDRSGKLLANESFSETTGLGGNFFVPELHARESVLSQTSSFLSHVFSSPKIKSSL
jgi:hypothetical protein